MLHFHKNFSTPFALVVLNSVETLCTSPTGMSVPVLCSSFQEKDDNATDLQFQ